MEFIVKYIQHFGMSRGEVGVFGSYPAVLRAYSCLSTREHSWQFPGNKIGCLGCNLGWLLVPYLLTTFSGPLFVYLKWWSQLTEFIFTASKFEINGIIDL